MISYRIYRKIPPKALELVGTVSAGTEEFTDAFSMTSLNPVIAYTVCAWDGVYESEFADFVKFIPFGIDLISLGCPTRQIVHSAELVTSSSQTSALLGRTESARSLIEREQRSNSRILTDGDYETVYSPTSASECVEIDLGSLFTISDVFLTRSDESLIESCRYEVSADGRYFSSSTDCEGIRFVRVYGAAGATEIEVYGTTSAPSASPIGLQRSSSDGYRIIVAEEGSPITATIFDLSGRNVWQNTSSSGEVFWNRCDSAGNTVPNGVYLIMVESDDIETFTSKIVIR